jgi:hypothetical protein
MHFRNHKSGESDFDNSQVVVFRCRDCFIRRDEGLSDKKRDLRFRGRYGDVFGVKGGIKPTVKQIPSFRKDRGSLIHAT